MAQRWSRLVLSWVFVFLMGVGCSTVAPSQVAPSQSGDAQSEDHDLYKNPEHEFNDNRMD